MEQPGPDDLRTQHLHESLLVERLQRAILHHAGCMKNPAQRRHFPSQPRQRRSELVRVADIARDRAHLCSQRGELLKTAPLRSAASGQESQVAGAALDQPTSYGKPDPGESTGDEVGAIAAKANRLVVGGLFEPLEDCFVAGAAGARLVLRARP